VLKRGVLTVMRCSVRCIVVTCCCWRGCQIQVWLEVVRSR